MGGAAAASSPAEQATMEALAQHGTTGAVVPPATMHAVAPPATTDTPVRVPQATTDAVVPHSTQEPLVQRAPMAAGSPRGGFEDAAARVQQQGSTVRGASPARAREDPAPLAAQAPGAATTSRPGEPDRAPTLGGAGQVARGAPLWSWLVPLVGGLGVFSAVLASTPPGFGALTDVLFGIPRGPFAAATAYALGAAGTLGLFTLLVLTGACYGLRLLLRRRASSVGSG
jgi:hypothetical protein